MPFDGVGFPERGGRGRPSPPSDTLVTVLIVVLAALLLITPISLGALEDVVRAIRGN